MRRQATALSAVASSAMQKFFSVDDDLKKFGNTKTGKSKTKRLSIEQTDRVRHPEMQAAKKTKRSFSENQKAKITKCEIEQPESITVHCVSSSTFVRPRRCDVGMRVLPRIVDASLVSRLANVKLRAINSSYAFMCPPQ
jgi:hypothetical protein